MSFLEEADESANLEGEGGRDVVVAVGLSRERGGGGTEGEKSGEKERSEEAGARDREHHVRSERARAEECFIGHIACSRPICG
jgi:hypothetical protein